LPASALVYATTPGLLARCGLPPPGRIPQERLRTRLALIRQAPWFGHGPGTFIADSEKNNVLDNQYLLTLIEIGLIGLAVVLVYLLARILGRVPAVVPTTQRPATSTGAAAAASPAR
jgi:O-antigen ligase